MSSRVVVKTALVFNLKQVPLKLKTSEVRTDFYYLENMFKTSSKQENPDEYGEPHGIYEGDETLQEILRFRNINISKLFVPKTFINEDEVEELVEEIEVARLDRNRFLPEAQLRRARGPQYEKRLSLPTIHVHGTHYNVGYQIGRTFSGIINDYVTTNPDLAVSIELYETPQGKIVYDCCFDSVSIAYPQYIREIKGISDGAKIPFYKLFLLHMEDVMLKAWPRDRPRPPSPTGTTTVMVNNQSFKAMGHVVDHLTEGLNNLYLVKARITEECPPEEFTALCVGGMIPGSTMGFNSNLVMCTNPVDLRNCSESGIPRSIICRAILRASTAPEVHQLLLCPGYGVANGVVVNFFVKNEPGWSIEAAPKNPPESKSERTSVIVQPPTLPQYYHFNRFINLKNVQQHFDSVQAEWVITKERTMKKKFKPPQTMRDLINIVGDSSVPSLNNKNIFSSQDDERISTIAVGIFNLTDKSWSIYVDNPKETDPSVLIQL